MHALWRAFGARVRGWAEADGVALLHELGEFEVRASREKLNGFARAFAERVVLAGFERPEYFDALRGPWPADFDFDGFRIASETQDHTGIVRREIAAAAIALAVFIAPAQARANRVAIAVDAFELEA